MRGSLRALRRVDALVSAATMDADTTHAPTGTTSTITTAPLRERQRPRPFGRGLSAQLIVWDGYPVNLGAPTTGGGGGAARVGTVVVVGTVVGGGVTYLQSFSRMA